MSIPIAQKPFMLSLSPITAIFLAINFTQPFSDCVRTCFGSYAACNNVDNLFFSLTAKVISEESAEDEVGINNTVTVEFADDGSVETYKIVTTVRGNSLENLISNESPLGKALLGKKEGATAHVQVNETVGYDVKIIKIENTVDDGSDKIRSF